MVGVGIATARTMPIVWSTGAFFVCLFCIVAVRNRTTRIIILICAAGVVGILRSQLQQSVYSNRYDQEITIDGIVAREPDILVDKQRLLIRSTALDGLLQATTALVPQFHVGDQVQIVCTLRRPEPFDGFAYDRFLARYHIGSVCYYPSITIVGSDNSFLRRIFHVKEFALSRIQHVLAPPENSIILGVLFGENHAVPQDIAADFRITGTTHVLVISGSNIVLLAGILLGTMKHLPLQRRTRFILIISVLWLYAIFTGLQSPAVRATIFGTITVLAQWSGRKGDALRLCTVAAAIMVLVNPLLLWFDAGFQLSFLATMGIIIWNPWFQARLQRVPEIGGLRLATSTTLSASITTAPLIAFSFHTFSVVGLFANLVVVPLISAVMILALAVTCAALLWQWIASWFALPLYMLLHLLLSIVHWFARVPHASVSLPELPLWTLCGTYITIGVLSFVVARKKYA